MQNFLGLTFLVSGALALVSLGNTDFFEPKRPAIDWKKQNDTLAQLKGRQTSGETESAAIAELERSLKTMDESQRHLQHKLTVAHIFLSIFVGCTGMFVSFVALLAWNRSVHGIRLSDSMMFTCLLDTSLPRAKEEGRLPAIREQLGLLRFYFEECRKIAGALAAMRFENGQAVVAELESLMKRLVQRLDACMVKPRSPYEAEDSAYQDAAQQLRTARTELGDLTAKLPSLREEHRRLDELVKTWQRQEGELRTLRDGVNRDLLRVRQRDAELATREKATAAAEVRLTGLIAAHAALRDEVNMLMRMLEAWDETAGGRPTDIVQREPQTFPRLHAVARSFLRRTPSTATA